jgi:hypothetical protein
MDKILESALLLEDDDIEDEEAEEDQGEVEEGERGESEISAEMVGPNGEIYASSSSEEEFIEDNEGNIMN